MVEAPLSRTHTARASRRDRSLQRFGWVLVGMSLLPAAHAEHRLEAPGVAASTPLRVDARRWLGRMRIALRERNYTGTAVHERATNGSGALHQETLRIVHRFTHAGGTEERERIEFLTGEPRELLRHDINGQSRVLCVFGGKRIVLDGAAAQAAAPRVPAPEGSLNGYRLVSSAGDRRAGRPTQRIDIKPRDAYRYGYRLWLDTESSLPLRTETYRPGQKTGADEVLERFFYTDIAMPESIADDAVRGVIGHQDFGHRMLASTADVSSVSLVNRAVMTPLPVSALAAAPGAGKLRLWVPPGFLPLRAAGSGGRQPHLLYGDGLSAISVFVEHTAISRPPEHSRLGVMNAMSVTRGRQRITVVGDVPARTVELIAGSVRTH